MAEPAVHRRQPRRQIALTVSAAGFPHGGGSHWVAGEIRCLRPRSGFAVTGTVTLVVVRPVEYEHRARDPRRPEFGRPRPGRLGPEAWGLGVRGLGVRGAGAHDAGCSASAVCLARFSSTSTCHFSLAAVVSTSSSKRSVMSAVTSATST